MLILALHRLYKDELPESNWVPMYGLSITVFIASIGLLPIPFVITVDILPPKVSDISFKSALFPKHQFIHLLLAFLQIRNATMTMTSMLMWVLGFITNIGYLYLLPIIMLHGCLFVFSTVCFVCGIYALIFIPETKGKSFGSVEKLLGK